MDTKITTYLCIFINLIVMSLGGFGFFDTPKVVEIQPKNPKACSTENITLTCTRLNNDTSKSLVFQVKTNNITDEEITIIDNKTISYTMTNLNPTLDHEKNVLCCLGTCDDFSNIDAQIIQVYDKPKPVENFRCVVHDYLDSMNCDWDLVVNPSPMKVILDWKFSIFSAWNSCPSNDDEDKTYNKTTCTWKSTTVGDFSLKELDFIVTVISDCGESASSNYTINTSNMVKPSPVGELKATVLNSRCINVSWVPNRRAFVKRYEIYYTSKWDNGTQHVFQINDTHMDKNETKIKEICGLHPYTVYTFTVRAHPEDKGYWSDNTTITAKTYSDIPSASPRIIDGAFKMNRRDCETSVVTQVTVYWLPLEEIDKNGEIEAIVFSDNKSGSQTPHTILLGSKVTHHTVYLDCSSAYSVTVKAETVNGTSSQPSTIEIPVASYGITYPEYRVEMANTTNNDIRDVYIECPSVSDDGVLGATVFWCEKQAGNCNSAVQWKEFPKNAGVLVLPITSPENYLYGISMETKTGSSGLSKWESCIYTKNVAPSRAPSNVKVKPKDKEDNTLAVTWTSLMCESGEPYIHTYKIQYCQVDDLNNCVTENTTVEVPAKETMYVIKDLEEDERYSIHMWGVTKVGMPGPLSDSVIGIPEFNSLTGGEIAGIICGVFVGALFIAAGAFFIIRNCYLRGKRKFEPRQIKGIVNDASVDNLMNKKRTDPLYTVTRDDDVYRGYREPMLRQTSTDSGMGDEPWTPPANVKKQEINRLDLIPEDYVRFNARTATSSEQSGTGVYSINEHGQSVHTYTHVDTNRLDARVEEGIRTRDGVTIVPQRQFAVYNVTADSPVAVADVGLNPVNMANRTVGGYVESTMAPVPMTTPVAVTDLGLNPENMANKAVGDYVESTIAPVPMTTPVDESAGTQNGENIEEETELQDQAISSSETLPDYVLSMAEKDNPTIDYVERENDNKENDNDELDQTAAEVSPYFMVNSLSNENNSDEDEQRDFINEEMPPDKAENTNLSSSIDSIEPLSKSDTMSDRSVNNDNSFLSRVKPQTSDYISHEGINTSLKTNSDEVLPSETLSETPISQNTNQPTDNVPLPSSQTFSIPKPVDIIPSPMVPLRESIFTTIPDNSIDSNTDQTKTPVISNSDNQVSALNSVSSKQNLKQTPTPYLSIDQLTRMPSNVLPDTDQGSPHNQSQSTTKANQSYVTTDQLNAIQASVGTPLNDTDYRTVNQMNSTPVSVTESPNASDETAQRPVQKTQPLNSGYITAEQIPTVQANRPHANAMMKSNTDYITTDQIPSPHSKKTNDAKVNPSTGYVTESQMNLTQAPNPQMNESITANNAFITADKANTNQNSIPSPQDTNYVTTNQLNPNKPIKQLETPDGNNTNTGYVTVSEMEGLNSKFDLIKKADTMPFKNESEDDVISEIKVNEGLDQLLKKASESFVDKNHNPLLNDHDPNQVDEMVDSGHGSLKSNE